MRRLDMEAGELDGGFKAGLSGAGCFPHAEGK
jgi:hypothetical protein